MWVPARCRVENASGMQAMGDYAAQLMFLSAEPSAAISVS
jgi:hypothetical protein